MSFRGLIVRFMLLALPWFVGATVDAASDKEPETLLVQSGPKHVPLIELFSSESCSSCPPADQWFSEFQNSAGVFKDFVPVAFQVDYWNYLNWKDEYSTHAATQRQIDLANRWSTPSVYTPGVVFDGHEVKDWSGRKAGNLGGAGGAQAGAPEVLISVYQKGSSGFRVVVKPVHAVQTGVRVQMVSLLFNLKTKVTAGENSGRELRHNFLVSDWTTVSCEKLPCEKDFKANKLAQKSTDKNTDKKAVAVWVESLSSPVALQATGAFLK